MSASSTHPLPPDPASPTTGSVRRHHTISAHSRSARTSAKEVISEETHEQQQAIWNDDEVVDQDWVGGVGAVGEKTSLHRQSSLPTRYHRGFQNQGSKTGTHTPRTINSLAAIAGNEADEEPWKAASSYDVHDDEPTEDGHGQHQQVVDIQAQSQSSGSPLSPHFGTNSPHAPSPPPATGVRRHVSLTYGAGVGGPRKMNTGLKRSGTLQATLNPHAHSQASAVAQNTREQAEEEEYTYEVDDNYEDGFYDNQQQQQQPQQQYAQSPIGRASPWSSSNDWRQQSYGIPNNNGNAAIDDVQRALSALEIASNQAPGLSMPQATYGNYQPQGQNPAPPRFSTTPSGSGYRNGGNANFNNAGGNMNGRPNDFDGRKTPQSQQRGGFGQQQQDRNWDQQGLRSRSSNPNMQYGYQQGHMKSPSGGAGGVSGPTEAIPNVPPIPQQYLQQGAQAGRPGVGGVGGGASNNFSSNAASQIPANQSPTQPFVNTPVDVPSLIATKGYNPANFDVHPQFARFFVIKSYTEDDVHKSLKYEIWSSTDPGNKRLDKAFKDTAGRGPIYLFFSVNASGHFCGMAEMLTPVDYTKSSTVWASDKWKGVFKVRWIFVRDIPNLNLRHIKLNNTLERKPVTNSRDTQELLPDAGQEMLKIFHTHPARTSLLQDFAYYEVQALQKAQATSGTSTPAGTHPSVSSPQMPAASMPVPNQGFNNNYNMSMAPMMQMGLGINPNGGNGNGQYSAHQGLQAMHQSVMRNPSPGVGQQGQGGFMGY